MGQAEEQALIDRTSADLPFLIQFETIKQMTTLSVATVGFIATLFGSLLSEAEDVKSIWFALGAAAGATVLCVSLQLSIAGSLFDRKPYRRTTSVVMLMVVGLLGLSIGSTLSALQKERARQMMADRDPPITDENLE